MFSVNLIGQKYHFYIELMKLKDFRIFFTDELISLYPKKEIDVFFFRSIKAILNLDLIDVFMKKNLILRQNKLNQFYSIINRLKKEEPIQYILGFTEFYGYPFKVNSNVLIPRPETEELVAWVINEIKDFSENSKVLDVGTGSGCIAISIKKELSILQIFALDISQKALETAKKNAFVNNVDIDFIEHDILSKLELKNQYDVIISNPPYVRLLEKSELKNNVLNNEPHSALFVTDDDPLVFYRSIAVIGKKKLTKNGLLFFEINQYLGEETKKILFDMGYKNIQLKKDFSGNDRMIKANL